jgi:class 3 adenylate cyclase/tetratricopeptide (TPR) repeat protein
MASQLSVDSRLQPYIPRLTLEWLATEPKRIHRAVEGTLVFADISGFTALSEKLAKLGKIGAEEMASAITTCFAHLLTVAYDEGGGLIKFGGDALLILFDGDDHAVRAVRAAHGMRKRLQTVGKLVTPGGRVNLRMSVGVHTGAFDFFLVGDSHRELIVTGPGSTRVVEMEGTAVAGEIVLSPATIEHLPGASIGAAKGDGWLLKSAPHGESLSPTWVLPELDPGVIEGSVPVAIRETLLAAIGEPEHRHVCVAFLHFDGTDEILRTQGSDVLADGLAELVRETQAAVDEYDICFLASDVDADGGKLILTAGAPRTGLDVEERMLLALRRIVDAGPAVPFRIGVNKGPVFAGDIGPRYRRTYTVMGDAVNLAARVMAKARPGQILATGSILDAAGIRFETQPLEPFMVKGKKDPVTAYLVGPIADVQIRSDEDDLPLVGRQDEIASIDEAMDSAKSGEGRTIEIVGPPGIGKTRLLHELRKRAEAFEHIAATCELYTASAAYAPFRDMLRDALDIDRHASGDDAAHALRIRVAAVDPELLPWLPLLAIPIDADVDPTPEVDALAQEFRRGKLEWAVARLLRHTYEGRPVLVTIEDAHWMDDASCALLSTLISGIAAGPWLVAITRREETTGFVAPEGDGCATLRPEPLGTVARKALLEAASEDAPLRPHELDVVAERSGGNPLFLRELLQAARTAGGISDLPSSVDGIVTAQIDRLPPSDLRLLRYASVLGASFTDDLVSDLLGAENEEFDRAAWRRLDEFVMPDGPGAHRFRHALMRDAAYDGLSFRRRRELHARVGDAIRARAGEADDDVSELLSMHYFFAQEYALAWGYSLRAGERAVARYANVDAAAYLERALSVAKKVEWLTSQLELDARTSLGEVYERLGRYDDAKQQYQQARRLITDDRVLEARMWLRESWLPERVGNYSLCVRLVNRALKTLEGVEGEGAAELRAGLLGVIASHRFFQGRNREAITWAERAVEACKAIDHEQGLAQAYVSLSLAYADAGDLRKSERYCELALAIFEKLDELEPQAQVLNNMGTFAYFGGRWDEAVELWDRGRELRLRTGDAVEAANGTNNVAEVLSDQGHLKEAEPRFREALRVWKAAGFEQGVAFALANLGRVSYRDGRPDEGLPMLKEARAIFADQNFVAQVLETDTRIAECHLVAQRPDEALAVADGALAVEASRDGLSHARSALLRARGYALAQLGRAEEARRALDESLAAAREREADHEVAFTLSAIADVAGTLDEPLEEERQLLLERLGIVRSFSVPLAA